MLSLLLAFPLLSAALALLFPRRARDIALAGALALCALAALSLWSFSLATKGFQLLERIAWARLGSVEIAYHVGVDGISYPMVLLTALLTLVAVLVSRREIHTGEAGHYALLMALCSCVIGVFVSLDLVLLFACWEAVLVAMFFLILRWGASNRAYAAMKFLVYTGIASAALFISLVVIAMATGSVDIAAMDLSHLSPALRTAIFALLLFACLVKMPIAPFHTWLPDAHVQAPTAGSVMLAGVLLKMGAYLLLRLGVGLLGDVVAQWRVFLFALGCASAIYGAFVCLAQSDLKRMIAYSSVHHMGFVLAGIAIGSSLGVTGAAFEMASHGIIAALLFALAGLVHERTGTFDMDALRGLAQRMPRTAWLLALASFAAMGLPGMTGFVGEFMILVAGFARFGPLALLMVPAVLLAGAYVVRMLSRVVFGTGTLRASEGGASPLPFGLLAAATLLVGIMPGLLIGIIAASTLT